MTWAQKNTYKINSSMLSSLKSKALTSESGRARFCLHKNDDAKVQEMVIALSNSSLLPPHRQLNKEKSYFLLEGDLKVDFFRNDGRPIQAVNLRKKDPEDFFIYRFDASTWHTVNSASQISVFIEVIEGPYSPSGTEYADWNDGHEKGSLS